MKDMLFASEIAPDATVVATAPELTMFTVGVPVTVRLVAFAVVQRVPPAVLFTVMLPEPKLIARMLPKLELKDEQVNG